MGVQGLGPVFTGKRPVVETPWVSPQQKAPVSSGGLFFGSAQSSAFKSYATPQIKFGYGSIYEQEPLPNRVKAFAAKQKFRLDPFQTMAMGALTRGKSVVVPTPTSSGKTLVGEFAINEVTDPNSPNYGKKLAYTTPRKALSNEKYEDLVRQYGEENVGLMTGDVTINRDAPVLVMTTEVLRNMFYNQQKGESSDEITSKLQYAVFDECHFIDDPDRGVVWEETMLYAPDNIQQIHLSATVENADQYTEWLNSVNKQKFQLIPYITHDPKQQAQGRPVPLAIEYLGLDGSLTQVISKNGQSQAFRSKFQEALRKPQTDKDAEKKKRQQENYGVSLAVKKLHESKRLPALFFTFSRAGCQGSAYDVLTTLNEEDIHLVTPNEQVKINVLIDRFKVEYPWLKDSPLLNVLPFGVGYHHGGMLPYEKKLVEVLTKQGLLKAVFATDTLAAGINVPVRTVVFTDYTRRVDGYPQKLSNSDCQQIMGRAGRRGMYDLGHVVMMHPKNNDKNRLLEIAKAGPNSVNSQFGVYPGMALNLIRNNTPHEIEALLDRSFSSFQKKTGRIEYRELPDLQAAFSQMRRYLQKEKFLTSASRADKIQLTPAGELAAQIPTEHNLLIAKAVNAGLFDKLTPAQLAVVISTMMTQPGRDVDLDKHDHPEELVRLLAKVIKPEVTELLDGGTLAKVIKLDAEVLKSMGDLSAQEIISLIDQPPEMIAVMGKLKTTLTGLSPDYQHYPLVQIANSLGLEYMDDIGKWCDKADFNTILRFSKGPGDLVNAIRRTANALRHIAESDLDDAKYGPLKQKAKEAEKLLLANPLPALVTPKLIDTDI